MINVTSIVGLILRPIQEWYEKRYPSVVVALQHRDGTAVARVASFGQPVFVRAIKFELLLKDIEDAVTLNQMVPPHGQLDCPLPTKILRALVFSGDLAVSLTYKTASGREAKSEAHIFNIVGGDGVICKVTDSGNYLSLAVCPECGDETLFASSGATTKRELDTRRKDFERDLNRSCPDHESSRVKFWF